MYTHSGMQFHLKLKWTTLAIVTKKTSVYNFDFDLIWFIFFLIKTVVGGDREGKALAQKKCSILHSNKEPADSPGW